MRVEGHVRCCWSVELHSNQRTFTANWRGVKLLGCLTPVPSPPPKPAPRRWMPPSLLQFCVSFPYQRVIFFFFLPPSLQEESAVVRHWWDNFGCTLYGANLNYKQLLLLMSLFFPLSSFWDWIGHPAVGCFCFFEWSPITSMSLQLTIRYTQHKSMRCPFHSSRSAPIHSHKWN